MWFPLPGTRARMSALDDLQEHIRTHTGCGFEICEGATHLVPGEGSETADVMVVGEAPGRFEDEQGRPFVGRAGQLLDEAAGRGRASRASDVFITNVVKARPPRNRDPTRAEVEHWMPVLEQQLALVAPRLVVPLGRHALAHFAPGRRSARSTGAADARARPRAVPALPPGGGAALDEAARDALRRRRAGIARRRWPSPATPREPPGVWRAGLAVG